LRLRGVHLPGAALAKPANNLPRRRAPRPFAVTYSREVFGLNSADRAELEELGWNERFASAFDALG